MNSVLALSASLAGNATLSKLQMILLLGVVLLICSLWMLLPNGRSMGRGRRGLAVSLGLAGLTVIWWRIPRMQFEAQAEFCALATVTIGSAVATITSRSPVYSAIWFAASLLGTSGLFLFQGAQFVGVATVAVYAGAIVVTFLFVLMLAQPEGHAFFDRISWGSVPRLVAAMTSVCFAVLIAASLFDIQESEITAQTSLRDVIGNRISQTDGCHLRGLTILDQANTRNLTLRVAAPLEMRESILAQRSEFIELSEQTVIGEQPTEVKIEFVDVLAQRHVANLGGQLFSRHLIAIQVAATLLLVALVGAIAIASRDQTEVPTEGTSA